MEVFRGESGKDRKKVVITAVTGSLPKTEDTPKYSMEPMEATLLGWVKDSVVIREGTLGAGEGVALLLDRTNYYAEQGGQVGDYGGLIASDTGEFEVADTQKLGDAVLHFGSVIEGSLRVGQKVRVSLVSTLRLDTMRNHTSTHLLNWALRKVLGNHVEQKGSLVDAEKTRFDFSHDQPLKPEEIAEVERLVNEKIYSNLPVTPVVMALAQAKKLPGVRAVFGEKYPDPVRVLLIGPEKPESATEEDSVEFCGGTHLHHTGEAGFFKIFGQELVAKGVRRITAVTGQGAVAAVQRMASTLDELASRFNCRPEEVAARIDALQEENKKLQQQIKKGVSGDLRGAADRLLAESTEVNGAKIITGVMPPASSEQILQEIDRLRQKAGSAVIVLGWAEEEKAFLVAGVTEDLVKKGGHAGNIIKAIAPIVDGKGGGKPNMAQGGGKDPGKLLEAMQNAKKVAAEQLSG
jgi:alanyl-tRNA synthetase